MPKKRRLYALCTLCIKRYEWIHLSIGILGNCLLLCGSIAFWQNHDSAAFFFISGSSGMLVKSLGELIVKLEYKGKTALTDIGKYYKFGEQTEKL